MAQVIPTIKFSVYRGDEFVAEHTFQRDVINIGKLSRSHLRLDDDNISRMHAVVEVTRTGEVDVADLGSTNGTLLNGEKISRARLRDGDEISLGGTRLVVQIVSAQAEDATATASSKKAARPGARRRKLPPALNPETYLDEKSFDEGTGRFGLEIGMFLGQSLLDVRHFRSPTTVSIGEDTRCTYRVPEEILTTGRYELVRPHGSGFALNIGLDAFTGAVRAGGKVMPLGEARASGVAKGGVIEVDQDTRACLRLGDLTFLVAYQPLPKKPKVGLLRQINVQEQIYLALSVIMHLAFLILLSLIPEEQLRASKDPRKERSSLIQAIQVADQEKKKEEEEAAKEEDKRPKFEVEDKKVEVVEVEEKDPAPVIEVEKKERKPDQGLTSKLTPKEIKERNKQIVQNAGLNKVLNQTDLLANVMGGSSTYLGDAKKGMKVLGSTASGDMAYDSGLNPFGGELNQGGPGGTGGFAGNLSSLGGGTGGPGGGGMVAGLGKDEAGGDRKVNVAFKDTTQKIKVTISDVSVSGELDKATVRRVIQSYLGQIKWCYQKELQKNPDLGGKVVLAFLIAANGSTVNPSVSLNTMATPEVGSCIAQKATRWKFPSPRNGGVVKVSYPFLFKSK
ncbi:MAG: hypothetical protein AMXMBFR64_25950 [Myxococcales bacterium]